MGAMPLPRARAAVELDLAAGDILVVLSDGIYEYEDPEGALFGKERVEQVLREAYAQPAAVLSAQMLDAARAFARGAPQQDDVTMVFVKRTAAR
jgi:phosphoserine phosphatase